MSLALRQRTAVVVFVGASRFSDRGAQALVRSQRAAGINVVYLGREPSAKRIAACAVDTGADAVEVCVADCGAVTLLRDLVRELKWVGRQGVSIVVHRVP